MPYWVALALTVTLEAPVYLGLLVPRPAWPRAIALVVGVNLVTHPLVWLALSDAEGARYWALFGPVEVGAALVEAALLAVLWERRARPLAVPVAVLANAVSCLVGLVVALV